MGGGDFDRGEGKIDGQYTGRFKLPVYGKPIDGGDLERQYTGNTGSFQTTRVA